jgi:DNA-directed RNA polymerase specialized sigma24 family protein
MARELHGVALEVIATALRCPYQTVVSRHARARRKVEEMAAATERSSGLRARAGRRR